MRVQASHRAVHLVILLCGGLTRGQAGGGQLAAVPLPVGRVEVEGESRYVLVVGGHQCVQGHHPRPPPVNLHSLHSTGFMMCCVVGIFDQCIVVIV